MTIAARQYSSGAENIASAHAIRQKLMRPANAVIEVAPARIIKIERFSPEPKHHVTAWVDWCVEQYRGKDINRFITFFCRKHGIVREDVDGSDRAADRVANRHRVIHEVYFAFPHLPLAQIGRAVGGRDPSSVRHALTRYGKKIGKPVHIRRAIRFNEIPGFMDQVREMYLSGVGPVEIERQLGISCSTVSRYAREQKWKETGLGLGAR